MQNSTFSLGKQPISPEAIDVIRQSSRLEEIASEYVRLRPTGKELTGLCPLHSERTPSFSINPDKQVFFCQGCQESGDVYDFVRKVKHVGFRDAVAILAPNAGLADLATFKPTAEQIAQSSRIKTESIRRAAFEAFKDEWITCAYAAAREAGRTLARIERHDADDSIDEWALWEAVEKLANANSWLDRGEYDDFGDEGPTFVSNEVIAAAWGRDESR